MEGVGGQQGSRSSGWVSHLSRETLRGVLQMMEGLEHPAKISRPDLSVLGATEDV